MSLINMKPLELCLPCLLVLKVAVSFYGKIEASAVTSCFVALLINHLSKVSVDILCIQHTESCNQVI